MDIVEKLRKTEQVCRVPINTEAGEAADEITRLRAENERLTKERDEAHYTAHIAETCCARAEERAKVAEARYSASTLRAAGAESALNAAERKLAMAIEPLRAARKAILMLSPNPDGVLGMQALAAVKSIDATLAELEKDNG